MSGKPRVLVANPALRPIGGGNLVAAWVLQALREDFEVSLGTLEPVDFAQVNRNFGTDLQAEDCKVEVAPRFYQTVLQNMPTRGALFEICTTMRWAQNLDRQNRYDVLFSTTNEFDFHRRGIQYVHYPWLYLPRPEVELGWYHRLPGTLRLYRAACMRVARLTREGLRRNLILANSEFVAGRVESAQVNGARVVFPPVVGDWPDTPWAQRRLGIAAVGRIHTGKRWDMAVDIVERVRQRGHDLTLTLIGHSDMAEYGQRLDAMAATRPWFRVLRDVDRHRLVAEISANRYGIHAMEEEHFGIAPAELQRGGCITFVHNSGGQVEIVGRDRRLTFEGIEDAAAKIATVIENPALEHELVGELRERRDWFSAARFCESIREVVEEFLGRPAPAVARRQTA